MGPLINSPINDRGLTRRQMIVLGLTSLAGCMVAPVRTADAAVEDDLARMSTLMQTASREGPLLAFRDFVADADVEVERHIKRQMSQRKDLLPTLKKKIGFKKHVRLSVEEMRVRLMFVPQCQEGGAAAYQRYCLDVTDFLFEMGRKENIFAAITSPTKAYPLAADSGICAFLVHRLAKDYQAVCRFTAESGQSVKYRVTGAIFSNHMGAVDLNIEVLEGGQFGLMRSPFTIWQNNSHGISTLLAVPIEESLHYWLGTATDRQIAHAMQQDPPKTLTAARRLAEEWMAVEESVVGGLVEQVLDRYCSKHRFSVPVSMAEEMRPAMIALDQYRYREKGLRLVRHLGFQASVDMYLESPVRFRDRLIRTEKA